MSIVGGAFLPKIQALIIDLGGNGVADTTILGVPEINFSYILPMFCFVYISWYGARVYLNYEMKSVNDK